MPDWHAKTAPAHDRSRPLDRIQRAGRGLENQARQEHGEAAGAQLSIAQLNGSSHGNAAVTSEAPAPRMGNLGDQAVSMAAMEKTGDLGALAFSVGDRFQKRRVQEFGPDIGIGETSDAVFTASLRPERADDQGTKEPRKITSHFFVNDRRRGV
jgi:hypothetical protein